MDDKEKTTSSTPLDALLHNLAALVKVKTIVTLVVIGMFAALALSGAIPSDTTMAVVTMVVAFYFGTQSKKE